MPVGRLNKWSDSQRLVYIPSQYALTASCEGAYDVRHKRKREIEEDSYHDMCQSVFNTCIIKLKVAPSRRHEPSLLRSLLIFNTLKHIETDMHRTGAPNTPNTSSLFRPLVVKDLENDPLPNFTSTAARIDLLDSGKRSDVGDLMNPTPVVDSMCCDLETDCDSLNDSSGQLTSESMKLNAPSSQHSMHASALPLPGGAWDDLFALDHVPAVSFSSMLDLETTTTSATFPTPSYTPQPTDSTHLNNLSPPIDFDEFFDLDFDMDFMIPYDIKSKSVDHHTISTCTHRNELLSDVDHMMQILVNI